LTGEQVHAAASLGDPIAQGVLARAGAAVASACVDLVNVFNPALVVLGGSVARGNPEWVQRAGERVGREALEPARDTAHIVPGELGDDAGLIGAALLVAEQA
jgi:glucokinase